jgi:hypothetical protein
MEVEDSEQYFKFLDKIENRFASIREVIYYRVLRAHHML